MYSVQILIILRSMVSEVHKQYYANSSRTPGAGLCGRLNTGPNCLHPYCCCLRAICSLMEASLKCSHKQQSNDGCNHMTAAAHSHRSSGGNWEVCRGQSVLSLPTDFSAAAADQIWPRAHSSFHTADGCLTPLWPPLSLTHRLSQLDIATRLKLNIFNKY